MNGYNLNSDKNKSYNPTTDSLHLDPTNSYLKSSSTEVSFKDSTLPDPPLPFFASLLTPGHERRQFLPDLRPLSHTKNSLPKLVIDVPKLMDISIPVDKKIAGLLQSDKKIVANPESQEGQRSAGVIN